MRWTIVAVCGVFAHSCVFAQEKPQGGAEAPAAGEQRQQAVAQKTGVTIDRDVMYATRTSATGPLELQMNIARPAGDGPRACIIAIHGGGWAAGHRNDLNQLVRGLAEQGFVAVTVSYRFVPNHPFPACVEDCAAAVRFVRKHAAEYGVDPHRIGAIGFSAGAHLAMMLGTLDAKDGMGLSGEDPEDTGKVSAVVSYFGPTRLWADDLPEVPRGIVAKLVGPEREGYEDRCRAASPVTYLSKGDAPILMFQGTADRLVLPSQAVTMIEAMTKAGVAGRAEMIAGAGHGWGGAELERTLRESVEFFRTHLGADSRGDGAAPNKSQEPAGEGPNAKPTGDEKGAGR